MRILFLSIVTMIPIVACQSTPDKGWSTQEDCAALPAGDVKDDCFGHFIVDIFQGRFQKRHGDHAKRKSPMRAYVTIYGWKSREK